MYIKRSKLVALLISACLSLSAVSAAFAATEGLDMSAYVVHFDAASQVAILDTANADVLDVDFKAVENKVCVRYEYIPTFKELNHAEAAAFSLYEVGWLS